MQGLTSAPCDEAPALLNALIPPFAHGEPAVAALVQRLRRNKYPLLALEEPAREHPLLRPDRIGRADHARLVGDGLRREFDTLCVASARRYPMR